MKTNPYLSDDRLVNAANASVRSYLTVRRPMAMIDSDRPVSAGGLTST